MSTFKDFIQYLHDRREETTGNWYQYIAMGPTDTWDPRWQQLNAIYEELPTIPQLAAQVLKRITEDPRSLHMGSFHVTPSASYLHVTGANIEEIHTCGTAHCLAGHATVIAGKPVWEHEIQHGPGLIGAMLYYKSEGWIPPFFCVGDIEAHGILRRYVAEKY